MATELILSLQQENINLRNKIQQLNRLQSLFMDSQKSSGDIENNEICRIRKQIADKVNKQYESKYSTLHHQIKLLKDSLREMDQSYDLLNKQYQNQRSLIVQLRQNQLKFQDEIARLSYQMSTTEKLYRSNQEQMLLKCNRKLEEYQQNFERQIDDQINSYKVLESQLKKREDFHDNIDAENIKLKDLINIQVKKRRQKEKQYKQQINSLQNQISAIYTTSVELKRQHNQKTAQILKKDGTIRELEKMVREMNMRLNNIEKQANRKIFKQKSNAKKAIQGLQMVRKYSDYQINKSKKKQKYYEQNKKQLISKIKERQNKESVRDTSFISAQSSRKSSFSIHNTKSNILLIPKKHSLKLNKTHKIEEEITMKPRRQNKIDLSTATRIKGSKQSHSRQIDSCKNKFQTGKSIYQIEKQSPDISNFLLEDYNSQLEDCSAILMEEQQEIKNIKIVKKPQNISASKSTPKLQLRNLDPFSYPKHLNSTSCTNNNLTSIATTPSFQSPVVSINQFKFMMFKGSK